MDLYIVGDEKGLFLSMNENEVTTNDVNNAKVFSTIGDAIRACIEYNKETYTFKVIPLY